MFLNKPIFPSVNGHVFFQKICGLIPRVLVVFYCLNSKKAAQEAAYSFILSRENLDFNCALLAAIENNHITCCALVQEGVLRKMLKTSLEISV